MRAAPAALLAAVLAGLLTSCASKAPQALHASEYFGPNDTYTRTLPAGESTVCEAARRALLSQGYVVTASGAELVNATKSFQPEAETHMEIQFRVVCTATAKGTKDSTLTFVSALQDRYALKKSNNSASVGVGAIGSLSLPFTGSGDSLVKVASETITSPEFYDRFFRLLDRYLQAAGSEPAPEPEEPAAAAPKKAPEPLPQMAPAPAPPAASAAAVRL